ncbi:MAG: hypothetical protein LBQ15_05550 [Clostridium sp.]|jgi:hypothetical protein|nr:hypothetical protein [Clostridium sp.]
MWVLASIVLFVFILTRHLRRYTRQQKRQEKDFWDREARANNVRRKPLDDLEYIRIPLERLPVTVMSDQEDVRECLDILYTLAGQKILNLTGYTNTDLKLMYGTPNITELTTYDQNYTLLARTLQKWASLLYQVGFLQETRTILEFALSTHTDVSQTYYTLAEIYASVGEPQRIRDLLATAQTLASVNRNAIVHKLQETYPKVCDDRA